MEKRQIKNPDLGTATSANGGGEVTIDSPVPVRLAELERRVSAAFSSDMASPALANLCQQLGYAVITAEQSAAAEAERALDPTQYPDPVEARNQAESAAFMANRLRTMVPRLAAQFEKVYHAEQLQTYLAKLGELSPERDALAQELRDTYQEATDKLVDLFTRVRAFEQRARQQLGSPPPNVEVLERIDTRLLDKVTLPDWSRPDINIWPPRSGSGDFAASFAASMIVPQGPGQFWADEQVRARIAAEQQQERERLAAHYTQAAREQEERENRTLRENWEASQRRE